MIVIKFGGTSVANPERIRQIAQIIELYYKNEKLVVVVSALSGVTNLLELSGEYSLEGTKKFSESLQTIEERHFEIINQLTEIRTRSEIASRIKVLCNEAEEICQGILILGEYSSRARARLLSLGERMSSAIISQALDHLGLPNQLIDTRKIIITENSFLTGRVNHQISAANALQAFKDAKDIVVVPGFISSDLSGQATTLGRGGSDFTASLLANYLDAKRIDIWTDVNGMLTAPPDMVSSAYTIPSMSYEEAMELSHFGARVIYPPTIQPALEKKIPIEIKNTFEPGNPGTLISDSSPLNGHCVKGFSSVRNFSLINISGSGMVGVPGIAMRAFKALSQAEINVLLITQSSSEHTISVGVFTKAARKACDALDMEFENEIGRNIVYRATYESDLAIIAMVGDKMKESVGVAGQAFRLLGQNGINIRAISQGGTERNISAVIAEKDTKKALNVLHDGFFLSKYRKIHMFVVGVGAVGGTMLDQMNEQLEYLKEEYALDIRLAGVANSGKMFFNPKGIPLNNWREELNNSSLKMNPDEFTEQVREMNLRNSIFIDNTASVDIPAIYGKIAVLNIPVVASNKIMAASRINEYNAFKQIIRDRNLKFLHETNVAAGLPVLKTIEDLVASGDQVTKIQAVLSGSLNYIFNNISSTVPFSEAVIQAREKGLTEPDPAIDLSGLDVRRKILILARTSGYMLELEEVDKKDIIPEEDLRTGIFEKLLENLRKSDNTMEELRKSTDEKHMKLRYVAEFSEGKARTGLQQVDAGHPAYYLDGMDNIILLYTRRYHEQPLVIKGAGAGPGVTASGVFADVMRLANK